MRPILNDDRAWSHCVYLLFCPEARGNVYVKVGISSDWWARIQAIKTACPFPPKDLFVMRVNGAALAAAIEGETLEEFRDSSSNGEWFVFADRMRAMAVVSAAIGFASERGVPRPVWTAIDLAETASPPAPYGERLFLCGGANKN